MTIVRIALDTPLHTFFDYISDDVTLGDIGQRALVPFGPRQVVGVIVAVGEPSSVSPDRLKFVKKILRDVPPLSQEILGLLAFCSDYYHHPHGAVILNALPTRLRKPDPIDISNKGLLSISELGKSIAPDSLPKQAIAKRKLLQTLQQAPVPRSRLGDISPSAAKIAKEFLTLGWVVETSMVPTMGGDLKAPPLLNPDQESAVNTLIAESGHGGTWLLYGVTGSGKTDVYLRLIEQVLTLGGQILVLVPEINLTPQLEARFRARFPHASLVSLHSGLAEGERLKNWLHAQSGEASIVIGTRLAVFTPMPRLKLIIVDEEHDPSFKQQEGLRYSARDVAVFRARQLDVPIVLGSATPSLESYHNAKSGRYRLLTLPNRAGNAVFPEIKLVDLRQEKPMEGFSVPLIQAIKKRLAKGEQSLLFINRRGYAPVLACSQCGWLAPCHRCSSRLVVHLREHRLRCHHCGHEERLPKACPDCGNADLITLGQGTQKIESTLERLFPGGRVLRVDRDSTRRKGAFHAMLDQIHGDHVDILVGTQMLAKGHDFENLTLVGVLDGDDALFSADFRASERTFAQLMQVAGRAGRANSPGEVLVQTRFPGHPLFQALQQHDYRAFADILLAEREQSGFPPFCHQALLRAEAPNMDTALQFLEQAKKNAPEVPGVRLFDPVPALMARIAGKERGQLLIQSDSRKKLHAFLSEWIQNLSSSSSRSVRWSLDVDPQDL